MDSLLAAGLALREDELARIAQTLGREPTVVEAHAFDAQWSEHCSYKSSRHLLRRLPVDGPAVMQGPAEDAGILHLGEYNGKKYGVVIAHESHNHPSQVVPFEGAATGIGGIVRDVLCMGAEVIAVADPLRFGRVEDPQSHQRYVAQGAVAGISAYGNAIGVPNIAGDVYFDEQFDDNCLVNVVSLGLLTQDNIIHSAAPPNAAGWDIVLVGKATDTSGFGGASFSSVTLDEEDAEVNKGAVQVPDPFLKNVIMRATYRVFEYLRERNLTVGFKDLGAGGIMGCTAEICSSGGFGAIVDLDDVNTAFDNMLPEVIAVGETQERLCWVLPGDVTPDVLRIYNEEFTLPQIARGACACVIGAVQAEKQYVMTHNGQIVMDVPIDFLTGSIRDELPVRPMSERKAEDPSHVYIRGSHDAASLLDAVLAHRDVCSREPLYVQYDSVVRGTTVLPRGVADAGVIAPVHGSPLGVALSVAGNPRYGKLDPFLSAQHAVLEAVRKVVAAGARPLGLTDCLNFGNPRNIEHYSELSHAIDGLAIAARQLATPFVSGNVSLYNESKTGNAIPASPIIACVGGFDDVGTVVTPGLKRAGAALYFVGRASKAMGGCVAADVLGQIGGPLPDIDFAAEMRRIALLLNVSGSKTIAACRATGDGGLIVAALKMAFASRDLGVALDGTFETLFGENTGWIVEADDGHAFEAAAREIGASGDVAGIGEVLDRPVLRVNGTQRDLEELRTIWTAPLQEVYP